MKSLESTGSSQHNSVCTPSSHGRMSEVLPTTHCTSGEWGGGLCATH
jgi:hypothetical protein